jgi:DNA-binding CsgD family transcriptional regulator
MSEADALRLLELLYEGVLSPQGWELALQEFARLTGSPAVSLVLWSRVTDQALVGDQVGLPEALVADYANHFHRLDPARGFVDRIETGQWYFDEAHLGGSIRRLPFYQDFLCRYDLGSTMASPFMRLDGLEGFLSLGSATGKRDLPAVASSMRPLMPHIQHAARLRARLMELDRRSELQAAMLDCLNFPVLCVTAAKRVVIANRAAQAWLAKAGGPFGGNSAQSAKLTALLGRACGIGQRRRAAGARFSWSGGAEYSVTALPLPAANRTAWSEVEPMALVMVSDSANRRLETGELLKQIFGLTPAELRLLEPLMRGELLQASCELLRISVDTGKTHLRSIFRKTGVRRQAELMHLVGQLEVVRQQP